LNKIIFYCFIIILLSLKGVYNLFAQNSGDFKFEDANYDVTVPFELWNNRIYVKVKINNSDTLDFLFDTGAGASGIIIDSSIAVQIGLKESGKITAK